MTQQGPAGRPAAPAATLQHDSSGSIRPAVLATATLAALFGLCALAWALRGWIALGVDDATYLGVGRNVLEGAGPARLDMLFVQRSPLYAALLALPGFLGAPVVEAAHIENVAWTLLATAMAGLLATRLWGWGAGILAAGLALSVPLTHRLGPSLRIDPLAAALVLLLVLLSTALGGSRRWWPVAVGAGATLGLAVLIKETTLVFAGVALAIPLALGRHPAAVLRDAATGIAAALLTMGWWLVWHLQLVGTTPYLNLPPLLLPVLLLGGLAWLLASWWLRDRLAGEGLPPLSKSSRVAAWDWLVPWLIAAGWSSLVIVGVAARSHAARTALLAASPVELLTNAARAFPAYPLLALVGLVGIWLSLRDRRFAAPTLGLAAASPFSWLTLAMHNEARSFLPAVLLAVVTAAGCAAWLLGRRWPDPGSRELKVPGIALAGAGLIFATVGVILAGWGDPPDRRTGAAQEDLRRFAKEIEAIVPPGSAVLVSYGMAFEFEVYAERRYDLRLLPSRPAAIDPGSPTGLSLRSRRDRIIALGLRPTSQRITALQAGAVGEAAAAGSYLVYGGDHDRGPSALTHLLRPQLGFRSLVERPLGPTMSVGLYQIDAASVDLRRSPLVSDAAAIEAVTAGILGASGSRGEAALRCLFRHGLWIRGSAPADLLHRLSELGFTPHPDADGSLYTGPPPERDCRSAR